MKRLTCICCCALLLFVSCVSSSVTPATDGFRCHATIDYDALHVEATLERSLDARTVLYVHEPSSLSGLTFSLLDDTVTVSYGGFQTSFGSDHITASAVQAIGEVLDACANATASRMEGDMSCGSYTLTFDEKNGMPLALEIPSAELSVRFSEWVLL